MVQTKLKTNIAILAIIMSIVLVFALAVAVIATPSVKSASADDTYSYMGWDEESGELVERETDSTPTAVTSSMTELSAGWYIVDDDVTIESTVTVNSGGVINLILVDGKTLTINAPYGNNPLRLTNTNTTLNIYGQAAGTGELHIESNYGCAIYASISYVNVYGGKVYAKAQENCNGSYGIMCRTLTVYGGQVTALGYDWNDYKGIGIVGNLVMYGGEVIAKAGSEKAIYGTITAGEDIDWVILKSTDNGSSWSTISLDENNKCSNSDYHVKVMVRAKMVGSGYSNNPYKISTADQLNRFRDIVNGLNDEEQNKFAWAVLMNDIDLGSTPWTPIGTSSNKYGGTFDGKGYTIRGLYINSDANDKIGFISYTGTSAKIKNLTLEGSVTATSNYANVGAFVGSMDGGLLTDCTNKATVNGVMYVGGLVGCVSYDSSNKAKVEKSVNQGAVTGTFSGAGGIAGNNYGIVENCYNTGTVTGVDQVGGIIGLANYLTPTNFSTTSCNFNYGTISGSGSTVGNVIGSCSNNPTVESNFYLSATPNKGIGNRDEDTTKTQVLTADEFKDATNFVGFDFLEVWKMGENYPLFAKAYDLWIGNDLVTESRLSGEGWSFAPETNTLTLDGYTLSVDGRAVPDLYKHYAAFTYLGDETLNLVLVGENSITNTIDALNVFAFYSNSPVTISGTGSLYLTTTGSVTNSKALGTKGVLTINGGTVVAQGGPATVFDGTATSTGVSVEGGLVLNGGSLTAIAGESLHYSYGLQCFHGDEYDLVIGEGIKSFVAKGGEITGDQPSMHKSNSIYANAVSIELDGTGWTNIAGTEGEATIAAGTYDLCPFGDYLKVEFVGITVDDVIALIEAIPASVEYTDECKNAIDAARGAYNSLNEAEKTLVTNYDDLTAAEEAYALLKADHDAAEAVEALIAAISDPVTVADKDAIEAAREAYDALTDEQKTLVNNYDELLAAEEDYHAVCEAKIDDVYYPTLADAYEAAEEGAIIIINKDYDITDRGTAFDPYINVTKDVTIDLAGHILTIGTYRIHVTEGAVLSVCNSAPQTGGIVGACGADSQAGSYILIYDCRLPLSAATIKRYSIINRIAKGYLITDINGGVADENGFYSIARPIAAEDVIAAIEAIDDPVVYTDDCKAKIDEARALCDDLGEDKQNDVTNYSDLTAAEAAYAEQKADHDAAEAVDALIDEIDLPFTPEDEDDIDAAKEAFNALTEKQKELVENKEKLIAALDALVEALIEDIGEVAYTPECKGKIEKARKYFNELTETEQEDVENKQKLLDAEAAYKALDDQAKADFVKGLIDAIGDVEYTEESKAKIDAAKEAYDALSDEQKALIAEDVPTMTEAVNTYEELHINFSAAQEVIALINAIGTVEYTEESKAKIDAAMKAYNNLSEEQKALVNNHTEIPTAEATYIELGKQKEVQNVKALIQAIGEVTYPDSKEKIEKARAGYDALADTQKPLVDNYDVLTAAEATYAELEAKTQKTITIFGFTMSIYVFAGIIAGVILILLIIIIIIVKKKRDSGISYYIPMN